MCATLFELIALAFNPQATPLLTKVYAALILTVNSEQFTDVTFKVDEQFAYEEADFLV